MENSFLIKLNSIKYLLAITGIFVLALLFFGFLEILDFRNQDAKAKTCEGPVVDPCICQPADIMLVVDRSGSMAYSIGEEGKTKIAAAKEALNGPYCSEVSECVNDDGCCPTTCSKDSDNDCIGFIDNLKAEDQAGLVSFSDGATLDNGLTLNKTEVKESVNLLTPAGRTNMAGGIGAAYNELRDNGRIGTVKVMIILSDGLPDRPLPEYEAPEKAKTVAATAKNDGIRIITIGYDIPADSEAEDLMKEIASFPSDYHAAPDSEELETIYNEIIGSLCDCQAPSLTLSRSPSGTIYPGDEISITSQAVDDYGIASHKLEWTTTGWATYDSHICSPQGKTDTCSKNIGSFSSGTIDFKAETEDTADNENTCTHGSFSVAAVTITSGDLIKQRENLVTVHISDPQGKADLNSFYLSIDSPALSETWKVDKGLMTCAGTGFERDCTYNVTPDCNWGTDGRILIFPYDSIVGFHNPAVEKTVNVNIVEEAGAYCSDGIDNDCDGFTDDADSSCDSEIDTLSISRNPSGVVLNSDIITFSSTAADASGIQDHKIRYWVDTILHEPVDTWGTGGAHSITIGPFDFGTLIEYRAEATDNNGYTGYTSTYSFTVQNAECYSDHTPIDDVTVHCNGGAGRCCGGVCSPYSCSLDDECSQEICSGSSWTCEAANEGINCCDGSDCDGCYSYNNGCEIRDYSCLSGLCSYSSVDQHDDFCASFNYKDWECETGNCKLLDTINCKLPNNWDGDSIACNCDCDDYDVEETISNGNCTDGKDNDCDSNIAGNDCGGGSCFDCEEPACDDQAPVTDIDAYDSNGIEISNGGDVLDVDTNRVSLTVTSFEVSPCAVSPNSLYEVKVLYNINDGPWSLVFDCIDSDSNGKCDSDISKNITSFSAEIPVDGFPAGTKVSYKVEATDTAPIPNTGSDEGFFNVISLECHGMPDLTPCTGGKCCAQVCDTSFSCSLDDDCSGEVCSGISWECGANNEGGACASTGSTKFRAIEIDNSNNPSDLTDYQVKLNVPYDSDMQPDFDDLRFVDKNGNSLSYWLEEKTDGASAVVWVKILSIPANSKEDIYMYYGNAAVESASDAENTFLRVIDGDQPLKGSWNFDEGSGITARDTSGNGNEGALVNDPTWVDGKFGSALNFDGTDDYVDCGNDESIVNLTGNFTIMAWVKVTSGGATVGRLGNSYRGYAIKAGTTATEILVGTGSTFDWAIWWSAPPTGTWYHVCGVKDSDYVTLYVDGVQKAQVASTGPLSPLTGYDILIGYNPYNDVHLNGLTDEVRIYNRALSADEISDLYNNYGYTTPNAPGKVLVRKYSSPEPTASVRFESTCPSLSFDGVDDTVEIPYSPDWNSDTFSLEAWINTDDYQCVDKSGAILHGGSNGRWALYVNAYTHCETYITFDIDLQTTGWTQKSALTTIGDWQHIVGTYDGSIMRVFIDGEEKASRSASGPIYHSTNPIYISKYFNGIVDEARIYNRALSPKEIEEHYNGIFSDETGLVGLWHFDDTTGGIAVDSSGNGNDGILKPNYPTNAPTLIDDCPPFNPEENIDYTSGCFPFDTGCEQRGDPVCQSGYCNISSFDRYSDYCEGINLMDYECNEGNCELISSDPDPSCDTLPPTITIIAEDNQDPKNTIEDGGEVLDEHTDKITITSTAVENPVGLNTVKYHEVFYRINEGTWNSVYKCEDIDSNGKCDSDPTKNISSFSVEIPPGVDGFAGGIKVDYKSEAVDTNDNTGSKEASFSVTTFSNPPTVSVAPDSEIHPDYCKYGPGITLSWNFSDPDPGDSQSAYQIQIDDNSDFSSPEVDSGKIISSSNFYSTISSSLNYNKTYYWRVRIWDSKDNHSDNSAEGWENEDTDGSILKFDTPPHPWPTADFSYSPENPEKGDLVSFTNLSKCYKTGDITSYDCCVFGEDGCEEALSADFAWDFDYCDYEGFTVESTEKDPTYYFLKPNSCLYSNIFTVMLKVTDQDGYTCQATKSITIGSEGSKYPQWKETVPE